MPIIKSAIKKMRQDKKRTARNRIAREHLRSAIKACEDATAQKKSSGDIATALKSAYALIDKAVKKHLIHANNGARNKSRLTRLVKAVPNK